MTEKDREFRLRQFESFKIQDVQKGGFDVTFQIGDKQVHAHKFMLSTISETFDVMFAERWNKKEDPIPIISYSFDDFKEFLTFIYFSECNLTNENIYAMVDIAEFYQVPELTDFCDEYLSKKCVNLEIFFCLYEKLSKYSALKLFKSLPASLMTKDDKYEEAFETVYKWAENNAVVKQNADKTLNKNEIIKEEISYILPEIFFERMDHEFLVQFITISDSDSITRKVVRTLITDCQSLTHLECSFSNNQYDIDIAMALNEKNPKRRNILKLTIEDQLFTYPNCDWCEIIQWKDGESSPFAYYTDVRSQYHTNKLEK